MQFNPADSAAVVYYSRAEISSGDPAKAVAKWQQWTKDHPNDVVAYCARLPAGVAGRSRRAMDSYKRLSRYSPNSPSPPTTSPT